jgi:hypothetical protein
MSDRTFLMHRRFARYSPPQYFSDAGFRSSFPRSTLPFLEHAYETSHSYGAYSIVNDRLCPARIVPRPGQVFALAATPFELTWSMLCGHGKFEPVVDDTFSVVGHIGEVQERVDNIFAARGRRADSIEAFIITGEGPIVASRNPDSNTYVECEIGYSDNIDTVLTDPDGKILLLLSRRDRGGDMSPAIDPLDLIAGGEIVVAVGKSVGKYLARRVVAKVGKIVVTTFKQAMKIAQRKLIARGATKEASEIAVLTEEELAKIWGGGAARPLTENQVDKAIALLREGQEVHVESIGQMRQIQGELGQLGVRSESASTMIPQRPAVTKMADGSEVEELPGSFRDGAGTYRSDPAHGPGSVPYSSHSEYPHINITLRNGKTLAIIVTGTKSF